MELFFIITHLLSRYVLIFSIGSGKNAWIAYMLLLICIFYHSLCNAAIETDDVFLIVTANYRQLILNMLYYILISAKFFPI